MDNKKTGSVLLSLVSVATAVSSGLAVWNMYSRMEMDRKAREEAREGIRQTQETMEKEKLKKQLLRLFRLYEDWEFESFADFAEDGDSDLRKCAANYFAERLYPYVKENMEMVSSMEGDTGTGWRPIHMTDKVFDEPACRIWSQQEEEFVESFYLVRGTEIWLLESGQFAAVTCIFFEKDGWQLGWRFQDRIIQSASDLPVPFEDLETGLLQVMEEGENK